MEIGKRLNKLRKEILKPEFINTKRLGGEVAFFIFDYNPMYELKIEKFIKKFEVDYKDFNKVKVVCIDLYEVLIEKMKEDGIYNAIFKQEQRKGTEFVVDILKKSLDIDDLCQMIGNKSKEYDIVFLYGIGKIFPIIRSHSILNKLQVTFNNNDKPLVMFYPGEYTADGLKLFNKIGEGNYYRAFKFIATDFEDESEIIDDEFKNKTIIESKINLSESEEYIISNLEKFTGGLSSKDIDLLLKKKFGTARLVDGIMSRLNKKLMRSGLEGFEIKQAGDNLHYRLK